MLFRIQWLLIACLMAGSSLQGVTASSPPLWSVSVGPEAYYVKRTRDGGTHQDGWMHGGRLSLQRMQNWGFFWQTHVLYAKGCLEGKNGSGRSIRSHLSDLETEGRAGYTIHQVHRSLGWGFSLTPFGGYGYYVADNDFIRPSPIKVDFRETLEYVLGGAILGLQINDCFHVGLDFRAKWPLEAKSRISDDPKNDPMTLSVEEKMQYDGELSLSYKTCCNGWLYNFSMVPFFRYRQFGGKENFPFDYFDTIYRNYGLRIEGTLSF